MSLKDSALLAGLVLLRGLRFVAQLALVRSMNVPQLRLKLSRLAKLLLTPPGPKGPMGGAHMSCKILRGRFCRRHVSAEKSSRGLSRPLQCIAAAATAATCVSCMRQLLQRHHMQ
jgi:hypothetical protein